jgi:hypothetical protein
LPISQPRDFFCIHRLLAIAGFALFLQAICGPIAGKRCAGAYYPSNPLA